MSAAAGAPQATTATIAELVRERAQRSPDGVAVRSKRFGIWQEVTWAQYRRDVQRTAQVLVELGVAPGDHVAIASDNRYEWMLADVATVAVRGVTVGVDPIAEPEQVHAALSTTRAAVVVAENCEQVDKLLAVADRLPDLKHVLYVDGRGVRDQDARLRSWQDAPAQGGTAPTEDAVPRPMDADEAVMTGGIAPPPSDADLVLPLVSLADRTARAFSIWLSAAAGVQLHFSESVATVRQDLREVQPTLLFAPSQVWERLAADIEQRLAGASRLKRWAWSVWRPPRGRDAARAATEGGPSALGQLVVHRALRDRTGLRHVRYAAYSGTVRPEVLAFFAGIGVPLSKVAGRGSQGEGSWNG
jgi:long-chain acyl-CoA synthetase